MRTATCDVCTAYIADVLPVPGIAPDGTAKVDRIGDLRIVCDDCAKAYEVIVRERSSKGVQPPDGTTEREALTEAMLMLDIDGDDPLSDELGDIWLDAMHASDECMHPRLRGFSEWCGRTQAACKVLIERLPDLYRRAEARANVAEPSMSTTSPSADSGLGDESMMLSNPMFSLEQRLEMARGAIVFRNKVIANLRTRLVEGGAKP